MSESNPFVLMRQSMHYKFIQFFREPIPLPIQKYLGEPDLRVAGWRFLNSPMYLVAILFLYTTLVMFGERAMKRYPALRIRRWLLYYNLFQILFSMYIFKETLITSYLLKYSYFGQDFSQRTSPLEIRMVTVFYWAYISKIVDMLDTLILVLRKKTRQMSFLHVYHHGSMVFNWYLGTLYMPGGQAFFSIMVNAFVHVIMYTYYLLSSFGPKMKKYLWWKMYLTQLQLIQLALCSVHILIGYVNKCKAPNWLTWFSLTYITSLLILFVNFYIKTYKKKPIPPKKKKSTFSFGNNPFVYCNPIVRDIKGGGDLKLH